MQFIIDNWALIAIALASGGMLFWSSYSAGGSGDGVSAAQAVLKVNREKGVMIDVCEPAEHQAGHAAGCKNIPLAQLDKRLNDLPKDKNIPVLIMCQSGMRARRAAAQLRKQGYANATAVSGGLRAWREAGLPVDKG
ncbi:thiosulfate sulfurtransferase GlpE [mine drainage metagenome]|uniref:Thiosulfate sulfurtransferase GlpE n=1 Tax=mine drainage metagenome TaxID=410659 RepID=A0A1J5QCY9_9ZZZZ